MATLVELKRSIYWFFWVAGVICAGALWPMVSVDLIPFLYSPLLPGVHSSVNLFQLISDCALGFILIMPLQAWAVGHALLPSVQNVSGDLWFAHAKKPKLCLARGLAKTVGLSFFMSALFVFSHQSAAFFSAPKLSNIDFFGSSTECVGQKVATVVL